MLLKVFVLIFCTIFFSVTPRWDTVINVRVYVKCPLRWFPRLKVATACFLYSPPDLTFLILKSYACTCIITTATGWQPFAVKYIMHYIYVYYSSQILIKLWIFSTHFTKNPKISNFTKNLFSGSRVVPNGHETDRHMCVVLL